MIKSSQISQTSSQQEQDQAQNNSDGSFYSCNMVFRVVDFVIERQDMRIQSELNVFQKLSEINEYNTYVYILLGNGEELFFDTEADKKVLQGEHSSDEDSLIDYAEEIEALEALAGFPYGNNFEMTDGYEEVDEVDIEPAMPFKSFLQPEFYCPPSDFMVTEEVQTYEEMTKPVKLKYDVEFSEVRKLLDQPCTKEYGWQEVYKDKELFVYNNVNCKGTVIFNKFYVTLHDVDVDLLYDLFVDLSKRKYWDDKNKETVLEYLSDFGDVIHVERKMPLFLSDRDNIVMRVYIGNKTHPELIKQYGLYEKENPYYAIFMKSIPRPDRPPKKGYIRSRTILSGWIVERDPVNPKDTKIMALTHTDFGGKIPGWIIKKVAASMPKKVMGLFFDGYKKFEREFKSGKVKKRVPPKYQPVLKK